MPECLLKVRELTVRFQALGAPAINGITFDINQAEVVALLGESGAGKTTLAKAVMGLLPKSAVVSGAVEVSDVDVLRTSRARAPQISMIPQAPELVLNPVMRVRDHVRDVLRVHDLEGRRNRATRATNLLEVTGLSEDVGSAYPHQLSGGQRQRAVIAQALASKPVVLIADEPTSALDTVTEAEILHVLKQLVSGSGTGLLFVTHDPTLLEGFADRVLVLHQGCLVESGSSRALLRNPRHRYTARMVQSILPLPTRRDRDCTNDANPVVEMRGISKTYFARGSLLGHGRPIRALEDINLTLRTRSILGLVGKSGAGKSTLGRCLALLENPDEGGLWYRGKRANRQALRGEIQMVWQHSALSLNPRFRALDLVAEPAVLISRMSKSQSADRARELIVRMGLPRSIEQRRPAELSGGQRQRLALARALIHLPSVLILDEPFAGLDLPLQRDIIDLLLEVKSSFSLSYLLITHDFRAASFLADEIAVMQDGRIVEVGEPAKLFHRPEAEATRELVAAVARAPVT